jgi:ketosteroid isomerase-like protein
MPTAEPITGRENLEDLTTPEQALAQFYRAFNTRDIDLMSKNWNNSDESVMDNPVGGIKRGWAEIRSVYETIFGGPGIVQVEFYDYTLHIQGDVFWAIGRERGTFEYDRQNLKLLIRTTRLFRRVNGQWRQVHHHGSIEDPALLETYQRIIRTDSQA